MISLLSSAIFGLMVGSFLNVCISRIPDNLSIIKPRSRCPKCLQPIPFYDNIPLLSFIILRGCCRNCRVRIPWRYPLVEAFSSAISVLFVLKWQAEPFWLTASLISAYILIVVAVIDFETMLIADIFSYLLVGTGLAAAFINPNYTGTIMQRLLSFASGAGAGAFIIWAMAWAGKKFYGRDAVGEGDIFLMAGIGALVGWQGVWSTLIMASFFGSAYGFALMLTKKAERFDHIPFGPFLALGALINLYSFVKISDFFFNF